MKDVTSTFWAMVLLLVGMMSVAEEGMKGGKRRPRRIPGSGCYHGFKGTVAEDGLGDVFFLRGAEEETLSRVVVLRVPVGLQGLFIDGCGGYELPTSTCKVEH